MCYVQAVFGQHVYGLQHTILAVHVYAFSGCGLEGRVMDRMESSPSTSYQCDMALLQNVRALYAVCARVGRQPMPLVCALPAVLKRHRHHRSHADEWRSFGARARCRCAHRRWMRGPRQRGDVSHPSVRSDRRGVPVQRRTDR